MKLKLKEKPWRYCYYSVAALVVVVTGIAIGTIGFSKGSSANNKVAEQKNLTLSEVKEPSQQKKLTLSAVKELSKKGEKLSWEDFEQYDYGEGGSGIYHRHYDIDENFHLAVVNHDWGTEEKPFFIHLCRTDDEDSYIDIRTENVEDFIAKYSRE